MTEFSIDASGNWQLYAPVLPPNSKALGTLSRDGVECGALVRLQNGNYIEYGYGVARNLPQRRIQKLLNPTGARGPKKRDLVQINVRLGRREYDYVVEQAKSQRVSIAEFIRSCVSTVAEGL